MAEKPVPSQGKRKGGGFVPALCNIIGTIILLIVIVSSLPLALAPIWGYEAYSLNGGSMAPSIPNGSVLFIKNVDPYDVQEGDVISFNVDDGVFTYRVYENRTDSREFDTKADADAGSSFTTVSYDDYIGRVEKHYPLLGLPLPLYTSEIGIIYIVTLAACGLMFHILADRLRESRKQKLMIKEEKKILKEMLRERKEEEQ